MNPNHALAADHAAGFTIRLAAAQSAKVPL
jgi:hypothetical protein